MNPITQLQQDQAREGKSSSKPGFRQQPLTGFLVPGQEEDQGKPEVPSSPGLLLLHTQGAFMTHGCSIQPPEQPCLVTGLLPMGQRQARISPFETGMMGAHVKAVNCAAIWSQEFTCSAAEAGGCMVNWRCLIDLQQWVVGLLRVAICLAPDQETHSEFVSLNPLPSERGQ